MSLWSLRKHYRGDVVCKVAKPAEELAQRIADDRRLNLQLETIEVFDQHSRHDHPHNKTLAWMQTPFVRTVYLDADTIVQKPIDKLLNCAGFGVTSVGIGNLFDGHNQADRLWGEIVNFQRVGPGGRKYCCELQQANPPVINSGVLSFGWPIHQHIIERSHDLICIARATDRRLTDETIIQLLLPKAILNSSLAAIRISGSPFHSSPTAALTDVAVGKLGIGDGRGGGDVGIPRTWK